MLAAMVSSPTQNTPRRASFLRDDICSFHTWLALVYILVEVWVDYTSRIGRRNTRISVTRSDVVKASCISNIGLQLALNTSMLIQKAAK